MRVKVEIELRRPARRSVALLLGLLLLIAPAAVVAHHQFPDVPNSNSFHTQIGAIAEAGITAGFPDGSYHPADAVTRQSMAAFMHRGFGRVGMAVDDPPLTASVTVAAGSNSTNFVPVRQLTITVPGMSNAFSPSQLVHLQGSIAFLSDMTASTNGCPCQFVARIKDVAAGTEAFQYQTFESAYAHGWRYSFGVEAVFEAPSGPRTYTLDLALYRNNPTSAGFFGLDSFSSLSAMTFPFGPTGTNDL